MRSNQMGDEESKRTAIARFCEKIIEISIAAEHQ